MTSIDIFIPAKYEALKTSNKLTSFVKAQLQKQDIDFENCSNIPHISLYQLKIKEQHLENIKTKINDICINSLKFSFSMNNCIQEVGNNVFWRSQEAINHSMLRKLLTGIVETIKLFKADNPLEQISLNINKLTVEQKSLVDEYGVFWGLPHNFDPHITLVYNLSKPDTGIMDVTPFKKDIQFIAEEICIGTIGYHGNIESVIYSQPLK